MSAATPGERELPFDAALHRIADGRIVDAKTIMLLRWAALTGPFAATPAPGCARLIGSTRGCPRLRAVRPGDRRSSGEQFRVTQHRSVTGAFR